MRAYWLGYGAAVNLISLGMKESEARAWLALFLRHEGAPTGHSEYSQGAVDAYTIALGG